MLLNVALPKLRCEVTIANMATHGGKNLVLPLHSSMLALEPVQSVLPPVLNENATNPSCASYAVLARGEIRTSSDESPSR